MLNVIYVSDRGNTDFLKAVPIVGTNERGEVLFKGAKICDTAVFFANAIEKICPTANFTAPGDGELTYYVCGLLGGEWTVSYGDEKRTLEVGEESGILTFTAPAGVEITISM